MIFDSDPKIKQHYDKLPEELKKAIALSGWEEELRTITRQNQLHIDDGAMLETEVILVLIGLDTAQNFESNIKKELGITLSQSKVIADKINANIFMPIRKIFAEQLEKEENVENLDAGQILHEIENPTRSSAPDAPKAVPIRILPPAPLPPAVPMPPMPPALYADKLLGAQSMPPIEKSVQMPAKPMMENKKYAVDPYRELP